MSNIISMLCTLFLFTGCSTVDGNPRLGMKFSQPYPMMYGGGVHAGLDIDVPLNTPVKSIADGYVRIARSYDIRGMPTNIVMIDHANGISSRYLHISKLIVTPGEQVKQGQVFAHTAMNGPGGPFTNQTVSYPHLHLEIYRYTDRINPENLNMACKNSAYIWPVGC
jgi:murein DD-endopeptidase MepM/ murein hydrolase activator NlpD